MLSGRIFNIQRYSVHDGPGIRTTVFLKGCPLACWWCHNPESQDPRPQVIFNPDRCQQCDLCRTVCPQGDPVFGPAGDPGHCLRCGACVDACPSEARQLMGRSMSVQEVLDQILRDEIFFDDSGGGVTFSGGEPLMQGPFLLELLRRCKERGLHIALDTCGFAPEQLLLATATYTDLYLYDIKFIDDDLHQQYTGVSNQRILQNLRALAAVHSHIWVRIPLLPGLNDSPTHLAAIAELAHSLPAVRQVNLLGFHNTASHKLGRLGQQNRLAGMKGPTPEALQEAARPFRERGLATLTGG